MVFELKLAWKYFRARRKSLARFTTIAAISGIAAGVASLIIAQALALWFEDEMRDKILANTAHISISMHAGGEVFNWQALNTQLSEFQEISKISPVIVENAVISGTETVNYALVRTERFENNTEAKTASRDHAEITIGAELAEKSGLKIGDEAELTISESGKPVVIRVSVKDLVRSGLFEFDSTRVNISEADFVRLSGKPRFAPTILEVSVKDIYAAEKTADSIRNAIGERYRVLDWRQANEPLFAALSLERKVAFAIISLIIFVAALNITTTLALLVNERRLDIAVMRSCGAGTKSLLLMFFAEGALLGVSGIAIGVLTGISVSALGNSYKVINLPKSVYSLSHIPFHVNLTSVFYVVSFAFLLCLAATIFPAFNAARVKPMENLRTK